MNIKNHKEMLLQALYAPYQLCMACPLGKLGRKNVVFGQGNADAIIMFIGEGPGKEEDAQGQPFVGRSGKLLTKALERVGLTREEVFITNIVKCRPPKNRKPTPEESATCKKLLLINQIKIIQPAIICTLGAVATQTLLGQKINMTIMRGNQFIFEKTVLFPLYHPAYILRTPSKMPIFEQDLAAIKKFMTTISK